MFHELTLFPLFNSLTILKELDVSLLHRTTSLRPGFFTLPFITLLVQISFVSKLINILIPNFFLLPSFLVRMTKRGRRLRCIFFTIFVIHVHVLFMNTNILFYLNYCLVCILCVSEIQSGFVIFQKRERLLSCIPCFSLFLLSYFGKILKLSLNLFFP